MINPITSLQFIGKLTLSPLYENAFSTASASTTLVFALFCWYYAFTSRWQYLPDVLYDIDMWMYNMLTVAWIMMMIASLEKTRCRWSHQLLRFISPSLDWAAIKAVINPSRLDFIELKTPGGHLCTNFQDDLRTQPDCYIDLTTCKVNRLTRLPLVLFSPQLVYALMTRDSRCLPAMVYSILMASAAILNIDRHAVDATHRHRMATRLA